MAITHAKVSPKTDVADTDLVRPSDWNAAHVVHLDHAELSAVSADQHHARSHAHDGADGSGTVAGANLTGTPGGELGGTWSSPTVDPLHGGSTHAAVQAAAQATAAAALAAHAAAGDPHGGYATDADLAAHTGDTSDAHDASAVSSVPAGGLAAGNVQAALNELDTEKVPTTRTLTAGAGLAGGGTLAANRTFDVNVDGSTLEISADALRVKDGGITTAKLAFNPATQAELDAHTASAVMDGDTAGGDLSGAYPNPSVVNDSHAHGSGTAPGTAHPSLATHDALGLATDAELAAHTGDVVDAHDASAISFTPAGSIAATDVQAAIEEVAAEAGTGSALTVLDEGVSLDTAVSSLDFAGAGVTATNVGHAVTVTIPGGGSGSGALEQGAGSPAGNDEFQSYFLTGNPAGGTFTVVFDGEETGPIDWDTTAVDFGAAIEALPNIGVGNVDVDPLTGPFPTDIISLTFVNALGRQSVPDLAIANNSLTGGSSPDFNGGVIFAGSAPVALTPLVELAYDTARNAVWANIGTVLAPDWKPITLIGTYDANGNPLAEVDVLAAPSFVRYDPGTGLITDSIRIGSGGASRISHFDDAGLATFLNLNAAQAELSGSGIAEIVINNSNDVVEIVASALQAELNGITGSAGDVLTAQGDDTALWSTVIDALIAGGGQAAFVPDPATPEQIRDSLVAAGLMAAA